MILKESNFKEFMCPLSMGGQKLTGCRGKKCAAFTYFRTHLKVIEQIVYKEPMYVCGFRPELAVGTENSQYPQHQKELAAAVDFLNHKKSKVKDDSETT